MKLVALTVVKIDGDIIEEFVRHTLKFADHMIVVDNASLDRTKEILRALKAEGLRLTVWDAEVIAATPGMTALLARKAFSETGADYLLLLDADEFIKADSRDALEQALAALPEGTHAAVPWVTYVPTRQDDAGQRRILLRLCWRRISEARPFSKLFLSRSFMDRPDATLIYGNHIIKDSEPSVVSTLDGLELAHFPVRSLRQIQNKALLGWSMFLAMGYTEKDDLAYQWNRLYKKLENNERWSDDDFFQCAWHYLDSETEKPEVIFDPLPSVPCLYSTEEPDLLQISLAYTRQLVLAYAKMTAAKE